MPQRFNPQFRFHGSSHSIPLRDIQDVRFDASQSRLRGGKPVQAYFTQGLQIVGVPPSLMQVLGRYRLDGINLRQAQAGARLVTSVHIETANAIHLLRVDSRVVLAYPQGVRT